jgi:hypothetical protein
MPKIVVCALLLITSLITDLNAQETKISNLSSAENSLRSLYPDKSPALQTGYKNQGDMWLLYSPYFDALTANSQTRLLNKYGLISPGLAFNPDTSTLDRGFRNFGPGFQTAALVDEENLKVNEPGLDIRSGIQNETTSATYGNNIVVAFNDVSMTGFGSSLCYSNDGGKTWRQRSPPLPAFGKGGGDPVLAVDADGVFYYSALATNSMGLSILAVTRSIDGGATWSRVTNAVSSRTTATDLHDKEWMTVDRTNSPYSGNVYVTWTRFSPKPEDSGISFVRSTDGGRTWSNAKLISPPLTPQAVVQGSWIAIGPEGEIYVSYMDTRIAGIAVVKSTDGGQTFSAPVTAIKFRTTTTLKTLSGGFEVPFWPSIDVDISDGPHRGTVYIVTNDETGWEDEIDVLLVSSTDGGKTWTEPTRVSDDETSTDQFMPALIVAPDGTLGIIWYDRRNDPQNNVLTDLYMTTSIDGGRTLLPNRRITTANWMVVPASFEVRNGYHGDYNQISAGDLGFVLNWADDRSGTDPDIYTRIVPTNFQLGDDFIVSSKTLSVDVIAGQTAHFDVNLQLDNGADATAEIKGVEGVTYKFTADGAESHLAITTSSDTEPRTYPILLTITSGNISRSTTMRLTVHSPYGINEPPIKLNSTRDPLYHPAAVVDSNMHLNIVAGAEPKRFQAGMMQIKYQRYFAGKEMQSTVVHSTTDQDISLDGQTIAVDGANNVVIAWREYNVITTVTNIFVTRSIDQGVTFSPPQNITQFVKDDKVRVYLPALAVTRAGIIFVAYARQDSKTVRPEIVVTRSDNGGKSFTKGKGITGDKFLISVSNPVIAADSKEGIVIVYTAAGSSSPSDITLVRSTDGETFSEPLNISAILSKTPQPFIVSSPSITLDKEDNLHLSFLRTDRTRNEQEIYYMRTSGLDLTKEGSISTPINVSRLAAEDILSYVPDIGIDMEGNIGIAWAVANEGIIFPGGLDAYFSRSTDGGRSFSPSVNLSNSVSLQSLFPIVVMDENGQLSAIWEDDTGGNNQIMFSRKLHSGLPY